MTVSARVLIVDDDELFAASIASYLCGCGHRATSRRDAAGLTDLAAQADLLVLGQPTGVGDTLALLRSVRAGTHLPIIVISSAAALADRVTALDIGADDVMARPVIARELAARIACVLRRSRQQHPAPSVQCAPPVGARSEASWFHFGGWRLDVVSGRLVTSQGVPIDLPSADARLLQAYLLKPGDPAIRQQLFGAIAPDDLPAAPDQTTGAGTSKAASRSAQTGHARLPLAAAAGRSRLGIGIGRLFDTLRSGPA